MTKGFLKGKKLVLTAIVVSLVFLGCGSKPEPKTQPQAVSFPWMDFCNKYRNVEGGVATCKCNLAASYNEVSFVEDESIADARSELARELGLRVKNMVKRYRSRTVANEKRAVGSTFEDVAKQIANQYLQGSRILASKVFRTPDGKFMVCAAVGLQPQMVKQMISEIARESGFNSPRDEDILYQEFKAYKAQQELEKATGGSH